MSIQNAGCLVRLTGTTSSASTTRFPGAKPLAYGQVYATLARLERDGHAEIAETARCGGPERTVYALTPEGRRTLV